MCGFCVESKNRRGRRLEEVLAGERSFFYTYICNPKHPGMTITKKKKTGTEKKYDPGKKRETAAKNALLLGQDQRPPAKFGD